MPLCPKCHVEYRDDYSICSDCGTALVPDARTARPESSKNKKSRNQPTAAAERCPGERFLANVNDAVELAYIKSALAQQDIPCRVLAEDISQYLTIIHGRSFMGVNVYIPQSMFEQACELLASYHGGSLPEDTQALVSGPVPLERFRFDLWTLRAYLFLNFVALVFSGAFLTGL